MHHIRRLLEQYVSRDFAARFVAALYFRCHESHEYFLKAGVYMRAQVESSASHSRVLKSLQESSRSPESTNMCSDNDISFALTPPESEMFDYIVAQEKRDGMETDEGAIEMADFLLLDEAD